MNAPASAGGHDEGDESELAPVFNPNSAQEPCVNEARVELESFIDNEQEGDAVTKNNANREPYQQQRHHRCAPPHTGETEDEHHGSQGSEKCQRRNGPEAQNREMGKEDRSQAGSESRAAGSANHVRIRQGISEKSLKKNSRHGERRSHQRRRQNPRQPDLENDGFVTLRPCLGQVDKTRAVEEHADNLLGRNVHGANAGRQHHTHGDEHYEQPQTGAEPQGGRQGCRGGCASTYLWS